VSGEPTISLPMMRSGAPRANAPIVPSTPIATAISQLPAITACCASAPPWV
jgi:hypothetical protein